MTPPPQTIAEIPGLGPIRVRAIHKAGILTVEALRKATLTELQAIPGMTEAKAKYIQDYLTQYPAESKGEPVSPMVKVESVPPKTVAPPKQSLAEKEDKKAPKVDKPSGKRNLNGTKKSHIGTTQEPKRIPFVEAAQAMGRAIEVLICADAAQFAGQLLRELSRFAHLTDLLTAGKVSLPAKDQERAAKRLRTILKELTEAAILPPGDRKAQQQLAESLAEASDRLSALCQPRSEEVKK